MKYKLGDLCEDGAGKLWLLIKVTYDRYTFQGCENPQETWEDHIAYADTYCNLTKVSL